MNLKYQDLITSLNFEIECPFKNCIGVNRQAVRWILNAIDFEISFLPNLLYDSHRGIDLNNQNFTDTDKCKRCSISLFNNESNALNTYKFLNKRVKEKLGFTNIAVGKIKIQDGLASEMSNNGHYSFFEAENSEFKESFSLSEEILK